MTTYRMYKDCKRELEFPLAVAVSYQAGDRGKSGEIVRGYVACDQPDRTPSGSNASTGNVGDWDQLSCVPPSTGGNDDSGSNHPLRVCSSRILAGEPLARASVGGRDLPEEFTFKTFSDCIRHASEEELERSWEIETKGTGVPEAYAPAAGWASPRPWVCFFWAKTLVSGGCMSSLRLVLWICERWCSNKDWRVRRSVFRVLYARKR